MKTTSSPVLVIALLSLTLSVSAREMVLPAGTLLQCTMNEPNFSPSTVAVGDPVLCHLHSQTEFGQQAFPRGSYLVGHLESAQMPGHFWGKGDMKIQFDRIGLPNGDLPLDAKVIATRGYKVDREGDIRGKGHARRDVVEWMLPPLWPWKVIMLPARGPQPKLKGESMLTLRLMDDVQIPQVAANNGSGWRSFSGPRPQNEGYYGSSSFNGNGADSSAMQRLAVRQVTPAAADPMVEPVSQITLASFSGTAPGVPVFVLKTGMVLEVGNYTYQNGRISYELAAGGDGVISSDEVDWNTTTRVNSQRGVRVRLRGGHPTQGTPGF